ncbi:REP element-mobilizing transposase RayT [Candidatus Electrothrix aarhusensis]|jgi:REP element-mobilizing transposase RayT|uniref:REP element-mobilizing transposase RayT n=1 Tax=Candidatus Electrothrix aarhusensis TaxID=1859131 RepID=A0A444IS46_9BACT|nr:REP element-mobilizing transposase RayT [Candidatus Electrothrix aarhusensis]
MAYNPEIHHRRSIRLQGYDYSRAGAYCITLCTHERECLFGEITDGEMHLNNIGRIVADEWLKTPVIRAEIELDEWVVMPNHFHGIMVITDASATNRDDVKKRNTGNYRRADNRPVGRFTGRPPVAPTGPKPKSVGAVMAGFKSSVTGRVNTYRQSPGSEVWQRNYWDHIIRNETELDTLRQYIITNPARWEQDSLYATG